MINNQIHKNLAIYFTRYHLDKSIVMLNLYYNELIGNIKDCAGTKCLIIDDYKLDNVLDNIKIMDIEKLDDIRILLDSND